MSTTGAVNDQASSQPIGGVVRARSGTEPAHHGSGVPTGQHLGPGAHPDAGVGLGGQVHELAVRRGATRR